MINDLWYKNAVVYCLSVATFMDADGDGIGDFIGLERRLDYLQGLGVTAIWLMPFQPSPKRDGGYDIATIRCRPDYGSLGDFVAFTHAAKQRGLRVLIDLVVNHTSDKHRWFQSPAPIRSPAIAIGTSGPTSALRPLTRAWSFPASRSRPGPMTRRRRLGTSIASSNSA